MLANLRRAHLPLVLCLCASPLFAKDIVFDGQWREQRFSLFSKNDYRFLGPRLEVRSDASVSMAYLPLGDSLWDARTARWTWSLRAGVPATDLRLKGGDDRNLSLYVVFLPQSEALALKDASIRALLSSASARVLVYVWGGQHARNDMLASPYLGDRGKTIVLRGTGLGQFSEAVDLTRDYQRAFGGMPGALVGLAVSADSDDTDSRIDGTIRDLHLN